ncbi:MAG: NADH-quinone oxidoreductase subunit NuoG [Actinomycetota bacterium]|nr:NADH-quinone oxidoreductase subunit NuoG [Actinomycetota bacterium]
MPRPAHKTIQLTIDGREVPAVEGTMLVDAAKHGDVEIPYFCYERKLGNPVGACRMCLVEIEGIPKLQTACSTPVKDGMVVNTQTDRVRHAQNSVVEFLLVNHPLDCPVCDKGGECPLQDITFGWGQGRSRFIEPKRHFVKPLALSPLVAIDRERCILCYRCVRFSQEVAEDYQLIFAERGAHSFVATHDGHPYVAPFSGNIIELCPVGALTSQPYRFRARPWDIEGAGGICTLCPSQCNVEFTVRDEKVLRVLARENPDVDDGWLCDKGRFAYQAIHADQRVIAPMVRDGGHLREVSWERALEVAHGLGRHRGHVGALVGGQATNEEGFLLQRMMREALRSGDLDSRAGAAVPPELARALAAPSLQATVPDLEFAHTVLVLGCDPLDEAPILDLRIRKGVRRRGVRLAVATARPGALDANADLVVRFPPGEEAAFLAALDAALAGGSGDPVDWGDGGRTAADLAQMLRSEGADVVIVWGERLLGPDALASLLRVAGRLGLSDREGAGLLEIPAGGNARGLREAGVLPNAGPGYAALDGELSGRDAGEIARAAADGELTALYLFQTDPVRDHDNRALWERALQRAGLVVAHASVLTDGIREHAHVVFPAESYAEKEGTVVHPDGRLQRLRAAIAHPGQVRAGWSVLCDVSRRLGHDLQVLTAAMAWRQLADAVPFYGGLTLEELGGRGIRWPGREHASAMPEGLLDAPHPSDDASENGARPDQDASQASGIPDRILRLGRYRPIWAAPEVEISPSLHFTIAEQRLELSPQDAGRLGVSGGEVVEVAQRNRGPQTNGGPRVRATAVIRAGVPAGVAFLADGLASDSANVLTEPSILVRKP